MAWKALTLAAAVGGPAYAVSYGRSITAAFEQGEGPAGVPGRPRLAAECWLNHWILRTPAERASFHFVQATLMRSRRHRVLVATYAGAKFALAFESVAGMVAHGNRTWWQSAQGPLLPAASVIALFALAGLRYAFSVPAEWRANWAFQIAGGTDEAGCLTGVRKAVILLAILPLFALLLPVHVALWGWRAGGLHIVFGGVVAWLLMEVMLVGMEKVPFTCSYVAGKGNLRGRWPLYVAGYLAYVGACTWAEYRIQERPERMWMVIAAAGVMKAGVEWYRRSQKAGFRLSAPVQKSPHPKEVVPCTL